MKPETRNQKPETLIIIWLWIITSCLVSWSTRLPANLSGENETNNQGGAFLTKLSPRTCAGGRTPSPRLSAHASIEKRYRDESIARFLKNTDTQSAHALLAEVCQYIPLKFYQKTDQQQLLRDAFDQLQIAAQNPVVLQQLQVQPNTVPVVKERMENLLRLWREKEHPSLQSLTEITKATLTEGEKNKLNTWLLTELAYALADGLDDYSYLLTPRQYQSLYEHLGGYYVGVGVDLIFQGTYPTIFDVVQDSPAAQAGIQPGDILTRVADISLKDKSDDVIAKLISGARKTSVTLCVRRDTLEKQFSLTRDLVESPTVRYVQILDHKNKIGYLRISSFDRDTALELQRAVNSLKRRHVKKLIIDLRCNGGGIMASGIDAARLFLERGDIVTVKSAQQTRRYVVDKNSAQPFNLPLVLLVDESTASAAEIFAAALQDHQRAKLVGQNTLGKAVVQTVFPLDNAPIALCITTASYVPPSRKSFQKTGIAPDVLITHPKTKNPEPGTRNPEPALSMTAFLSDQDPTLQTALNILTANPPQLAKK
jgi:carboxyl-terminal processing protease